MKIIAIVQARQDSKRFPNKVLKKIKKKKYYRDYLFKIEKVKTTIQNSICNTKKR